MEDDKKHLVNKTNTAHAVLTLLSSIGENVERPGLKETPSRVAKAFHDTWTAGYGKDPAGELKLFEDGAELCNTKDLVTVTNLPVYSMCEHHMSPFWGRAHIGYIPNSKVVGLSKFKRLVDVFAQRLQVQERLTNQIADALQDTLNPLGVGVILECRHMCMESRGVRTPGSVTLVSAMRGVFKDDAATRAEFLSFVQASSATHGGVL